MTETVGEALGRLLRAAGVTQVFGRGVPGLPCRAVDDGGLAVALAAADGRLGPGPGAAFLDDQTLVLTARPGGATEVTPLPVKDLLAQAIGRAADWCANDSPGVAAFRIDIDLDDRAPEGLDPVGAPPRPAVELPERLPDGCLLFAGPGVVRRGHVEALRELTARTRRGVVNTWGAKGLFEWDDERHLGTIGLQQRDFEMAGFGEAELIVSVGVDADEAPAERFGLAEVLPVPPEQIGDLGRILAPNRGPIARPRLLDALSAVCMPSYQRADLPLHPGRAIIETKSVLGPADRVAADPGGELGLWVARAFPTSFLGSVVVPATRAPGFAAAAAVAAACRPDPVRVVAVTAGPPDAATQNVLELGRSWGVDVVVLAWGEAGSLSDPSELGRRIREATKTGGVQVVEVPVDWSRTVELTDVAGPLVAWT